MNLPRLLEPRDARSAAATGTVFAFAAAAVLGVLAVAAPGFAGQGYAVVAVWCVVAGLVVVGTLAHRVPGIFPSWFWGTVPTVVIAVTVALDLATEDASAGAQIFLCWPVLYASYQLRARAAALVWGQVVVGDALVVAFVLPPDEALADLVAVSTTLAVMTWILVTARDRQEQLVGQLRAQATVDALTGLATRRVLDEAAHDALDTEGRREVSLFLLDVDEFKLVNDTYGHPGGDAVLTHLARVLTEHCRPEDAVIARLGGDELAVLLPGCPLGVAVERAWAVRDAVRSEPVPLGDGRTVAVTVSLGVAAAPRHARTLRELYGAADAALYEAKRSGRDRVGSVPEVTPAQARARR